MRGWTRLALVAALFGCSSEGGDDVAAVPSYFGDGPAVVAHVLAYEQMDTILNGEFSAENIGDPTPFIGSDATSPSAPATISSVYYETTDLPEAVGAIRDKRPRIEPEDDAPGGGMVSGISTALTLGAMADAGSARGGALWYGHTVARTLDRYFLLVAYKGLSRRTEAGFDEATAVFWDAAGAPQGLGRVIAAGDAGCGAEFLPQLGRTLGEIQGPFADALQADGLPDALGQRALQPGAFAAYDTAIDAAETLMTQGLGMALVAELSVGTFDAASQARARAAYTALSARIFYESERSDTEIAQALDADAPGNVDRAVVIDHLTRKLGLPACAR